MRLFKSMLVIMLMGSSCRNDRVPHLHRFNAVSKDSISDIRSYSGNAFAFSDFDYLRNRIFIIPVPELDSQDFIKADINIWGNNRLSIQIIFNHDDLLTLDENPSKELLLKRLCNLPLDSIYFSRVYISYKNLREVRIRQIGKNGLETYDTQSDSCNTRMVDVSDSSTFDVFRVYHVIQ